MAAYNVTNIGRPIKLNIGTPALTVRDITSWTINDEKTIEFVSSGNSVYDRHYLTKFGNTLEIESSDASLAVGLLQKGATVENADFYCESVYVGDAGGVVNTIGLQKTDQLRVYYGYAIIEESGNVSGNADGTAATYKIKLRAIRKPDGTAPVVTVGISAWGAS